MALNCFSSLFVDNSEMTSHPDSFKLYFQGGRCASILWAIDNILSMYPKAKLVNRNENGIFEECRKFKSLYLLSKKQQKVNKRSTLVGFVLTNHFCGKSRYLTKTFENCTMQAIRGSQKFTKCLAILFKIKGLFGTPQSVST